MEFKKRYQSLNEKQKQAVDTIDGPVMVVAGPGTGKTELLSVRIANILQKTDTLPENILCLTFTESGAYSMQERLLSIIGKSAYKVAVHTFHSFGNEIINRYSEFFYNGAQFRPSDELTRQEILISIFDGLEYNNPLKKTMNGEYTYLSDTMKTIAELKRSGFTSDELLNILDSNETTIQVINDKIGPIFANRINKAMAEILKDSIETVEKTKKTTRFENIPALSNEFILSLSTALDEVAYTNKTTSLTAFKKDWFEKDKSGNQVLKSTARQKKLRALSAVYASYLSRMQEAELFDFDDMILRTVHALEVFPELRYNLQEQYQYILVDEFQDTNMAQMRILNNLTDLDVDKDKANIMVVGDDDQAIYSFQGADISNILDFTKRYPNATVITLKENYRSGSDILKLARSVIVQGSNRLENRIKSIDKELSAQSNNKTGTVSIHEAADVNQEKAWLTDVISSKIKKGQNPSSIAVIARKHHQIEELLPFFAHHDIEVQYERRNDVLKQAPVASVIQLARFLSLLTSGRLIDASSMLPEILAHPAWGLEPKLLLNISLQSHNQHKMWIETLADFEEIKNEYDWLLEMAFISKTETFEIMLDKLIGTKPGAAFTSPYYNYYFGQDKLDEDPDLYIRYLKSISKIRKKMREYSPHSAPDVDSLINFIDLYVKTNSTIYLIENEAGSPKGVNLLTAHKAKGLEFDSVFVYDSTETTWGLKSRSRNRLLNYPENLPIADGGDGDDERLRLFYVALTRAKKELLISYSLSGNKSKFTDKAGFMQFAPKTDEINHENLTINDQTIEEILWHEPLVNSHQTLKEVLASKLKTYHLPVTHLIQFLDVTRGGPQQFLLKNLLKFPEAMSSSAVYGSAVHDTLHAAHVHMRKHNQPQAIEDITGFFENQLSKGHLSEKDYIHYLEKGTAELGIFLQNTYSSFNSAQLSEIDFKKQGVVINSARLTGKIDLINPIDKFEVEVCDYKTGSPVDSWKPKSPYDKIKMHHYYQQLLFYKILLANSRDYSRYTVNEGRIYFIEPTEDHQTVSRSVNLLNDDVVRLNKLIDIVWRRIQDLDLPDTSQYKQTVDGIKQFEYDLLEGSI